jgi:hypothetical protein
LLLAAARISMRGEGAPEPKAVAAGRAPFDASA